MHDARKCAGGSSSSRGNAWKGKSEETEERTDAKQASVTDALLALMVRALYSTVMHADSLEFPVYPVDTCVACVVAWDSLESYVRVFVLTFPDCMSCQQ